MDSNSHNAFRLIPPPLRIFIGVVLIGEAGILASHTRAALPVTAPVLAVYHVIRNRAGGASLAEAVDAGRAAARQSAAAWRVQRELLLLQRQGDFAQWRTPLGDYWAPAGSGENLSFVVTEQMRDIYGNAEDGVHPGDVVLDCGANIGAFTRVALSRGAKLVVAIEPAPENLVSLRRNFASEIASGKVVVYPKGVWDRDEVLNLKVDVGHSARDTFLTPSWTPTARISLPVTTIDALVKELQLPRVDFIKMDIEGAEQKAIAGARGVITGYRPRMALCTYHLPEDAAGVPGLVAKFVPGYRLRRSYELTAERLLLEVAHFF